MVCLANLGADVSDTANFVFEQAPGPLTTVTATNANTYSAISYSQALVGMTYPYTLTGTAGAVDEKVHLAPDCSAIDFRYVGDTITANTVDPTFTQSIQPFALGIFSDYYVCLQKITGSDEIAQISASRRLTADTDDANQGRRLAGGPIVVVVETAAATGDPVAYFGSDRKVSFWLPFGVFMPLLRTPDLDIWGKTQPGLVGEKGQYFDQFVVASRGGLLVDIKIRAVPKTQDMMPPTDVGLLPTTQLSDLHMLDVSVIDGHARASDGIDDGWMQVQALTRKDADSLSSTALPHEAIEVLAASAHFTICAGYTINKADAEEHILHDFAHLSLQMIAMPQADTYRGVFPELWGLKPPSPCTSTLMEMTGGYEEVQSDCFSWDAYHSSETVDAVPQVRSECEATSGNCSSNSTQDVLLMPSSQDIRTSSSGHTVEL